MIQNQFQIDHRLNVKSKASRQKRSKFYNPEEGKNCLSKMQIAVDKK